MNMHKVELFLTQADKGFDTERVAGAVPDTLVQRDGAIAEHFIRVIVHHVFVFGRNYGNVAVLSVQNVRVVFYGPEPPRR